MAPSERSAQARGARAGRLRRERPRRRAKARAELEREVASARLSAGSREVKFAEGWSDLQRSWDAHVAKVRERLDNRRADHDAKRAQRRAEDAEDYAAYAAAFAHSAVVEAEYAALDAVLARMDRRQRRQRDCVGGVSHRAVEEEQMTRRLLARLLTKRDITFDPTQDWKAYPDFAEHFAQLWGATR